MVISPLPTPPTRLDPTNFAARADAFLGAMLAFQGECNVFAAAVSLITTGTTISGVLLGTTVNGSAALPAGTTAQRDPVPNFGYTRANTTLNRVEWWNNTFWAPMGGGATGGSSDDIFTENSRIMTANYSISPNKNAMMVGPLTVNSGVSLTIPTGARLVIL
jgi:hypothetical protein